MNNIVKSWSPLLYHLHYQFPAWPTHRFDIADLNVGHGSEGDAIIVAISGHVATIRDLITPATIVVLSNHQSSQRGSSHHRRSLSPYRTDHRSSQWRSHHYHTIYQLWSPTPSHPNHMHEDLRWGKRPCSLSKSSFKSLKEGSIDETIWWLIKQRLDEYDHRLRDINHRLAKLQDKS